MPEFTIKRLFANIALWAALGAVTLWCLLLDFTPPVAKDALIHHLAIPKIWLAAGGFVETPWAMFSYYPMNLQLLYLLPLALKIDFAAKFIHFAFGLATAGLLYRFIKRELNSTWALMAALIFLSTPAVMRLATSAYVDLGLTFFVAAALMSLYSWAENGRKSRFIFSAVCLGLALGTKYNGLLGVPLLIALVVLIRNRKGDGLAAALGWAAGYGLIALAVFSPWLIKNYALTGNPLYPLYNHFFGLEGLAPEGVSLGPLATRRLLYGESELEIWTAPLRAFFQGQDYSPRYFDGVLNPIFILLPPLALIAPRRNGAPALAAFSAAWIALVFFQSSFICRYILPALPCLTVLTVFGLHRLTAACRNCGYDRIGKALAGLIVVAALGLNAVWAFNHWRFVDPNDFLTGRESRLQFLERRLSHFRAMEYINSQTPGESRILFLFAGNRGYYCDRNYFYRTYYSGQPVLDVTTDAPDWRHVAARLRAMGADFVLVQDHLLERFLTNSADEDQRRLWAEFTRKGWVRRFEANGFSVYELRNNVEETHEAG